jgi:hypothetical protein
LHFQNRVVPGGGFRITALLHDHPMYHQGQ